MTENQSKGLVLLYTGDGKGKTTAALGQVIRAAGHNLRICVIQFIKGKWPTGEAAAMQSFAGQVEFHTLGSGFTWKADDKSEVVSSGRAAWQTAKAKMASGQYDFLVLDELTYLMSYGIIEEEDCLDAIRSRPSNLNIVITGRNASPGLIDAADLVTEMKLVKHHYEQGIAARKGIEY